MHRSQERECGAEKEALHHRARHEGACTAASAWQLQWPQPTLNRPCRNGLPRYALKQPHNSYRWLPVVEQEIPNRQGVDLFVGQ